MTTLSANLLARAIIVPATAGVIIRPFKLPEAIWAVTGAILLVALGLLPYRLRSARWPKAICRRHPQLNATVLDLAAAVESAAPLLAAEGLGSRVVHVVGDVTTADFGTDQYDLIFMSNLAHHLDENETRFLAIKVASALRPGGVFVVQEAVRPPKSKKGGQTATLLGLYFAFQSRPGVTTWTVDDIRSWQTGAGLTPQNTLRLYTAPGWVQQSSIREK